MGRTTSGTSLVDGVDGSPLAKERTKAILDTISGRTSIGAAAKRLGVSETMVHGLRERALTAAVQALEPKPPGRPRKTVTAEEQRIRELENDLRDLKVDLMAAEVREEVAASMPHLLEKKEIAGRKKAAGGAEAEAVPASAPPLSGRQRHERKHRARLTEACRLRGLEKKPRGRNGLMIQHERRQCEAGIRRAAVTLVRWATVRCGLSLTEIARRIGMPESTLRSWGLAWNDRKLRDGAARGRPAQRPDWLTRTAILTVFFLMGPGIGVPTMQLLFPDVARAALENLLKRYRKMSSRRKRRLIRTVTWRKPGAVWAMDYFEPPVPIEGMYGWVLAVRDLASGRTLAAMPVKSPDGRATCDLLRSLFLSEGPPLVIKSDNGSHFTAECVQQVLLDAGVVPLLSPPGLPEYNGAIEAGVGSLKVRTHYLAARHGRPGQWTCDDIEGARLLANATGRPRGLDYGTPNQAWRERQPIGWSEHAAFQVTLASMRSTVRAERGYLPNIELDDPTNDALERMAIVRALMQSGYLEIGRSRIPQPVRRAEPA